MQNADERFHRYDKDDLPEIIVEEIKNRKKKLLIKYRAKEFLIKNVFSRKQYYSCGNSFIPVVAGYN